MGRIPAASSQGIAAGAPPRTWRRRWWHRNGCGSPGRLAVLPTTLPAGWLNCVDAPQTAGGSSGRKRRQRLRPRRMHPGQGSMTVDCTRYRGPPDSRSSHASGRGQVPCRSIGFWAVNCEPACNLDVVEAQTVVCDLSQERTCRRRVGWCYRDGKDVGRAVVAAGLARDCRVGRRRARN